MTDCVFCKIVAEDVPATKVFEDDAYLAFEDIQPKAPVHYLVIPKAHSSRLDALLEDEGAAALGELLAAAVKTAESKGLSDYRLGVNVGAGAGQVVFHTHVHVLGGWQATPGDLS